MHAKRALARGDDPEEVIRRIADFRSSEKSDPLYYARLTVKKAQADMGRESLEATSMRESEQIDAGRSSSDKSLGTRDSATKWRISGCRGGWSVTGSTPLDGI